MSISKKLRFSKERTECFSRELITWSKCAGNRRQFAWRETSEPYRILVAELLLRRTNARAVESVYKDLLLRYPSLKRLAFATEADLSELLFSLGLNWRTRNIAELARAVKSGTVKVIPGDLVQLKQLPGVGDYVARAILINAFHARITAIDNNVVRVLCRYFGIRQTDSLRRNAEFQYFGDTLIGEHDPRDFNYALLDLAAGVCTPRTPKCNICPLRKTCSFGKKMNHNQMRGRSD